MDPYAILSDRFNNHELQALSMTVSPAEFFGGPLDGVVMDDFLVICQTLDGRTVEARAETPALAAQTVLDNLDVAVA